MKRLQIKTRKPFYLIAAVAAVIGGVRVAWPVFGPELIVNYTHSEPYGVYKMRRLSPEEYRRGMMVALPVPDALKEVVTSRGYINAGHPLMKGIGALEGDVVCVNEQAVTINGVIVGPVFTVDSSGRPLPSVRGCMTIKHGEFFPLSTYTAKSFDGRYIGPQPLSKVLGQLEPVWTF